ASQRHVKDAGRGELVEGPRPLGEAPFVASPLGGGTGVTAGASGVAAIGKLQVRLERRRQPPAEISVVVPLPQPRRWLAVAERFSAGAIDEDQRLWPAEPAAELRDAAEALVAKVARSRLLPSQSPASPRIGERTEHRQPSSANPGGVRVEAVAQLV